MRPAWNERIQLLDAESQRSPAPRAFILLLVVPERLDQAAQDFGGRLEHRLELRLIDFLDVLAQMIFDLLQALLHLLGMMARIALGGGGGHDTLLVTACGTCLSRV
jgi:hypothetical protein